jgi:hypothetical protein
MPILRCVASACAAFVLCIGFVDAEDKATPRQAAAHKQWAGSWEMCVEVNRLLGFGGGENRSDATCDHPSSFSLTLDEAVGATLGAEKVAAYRDHVFERMGHRIVATGKWKTKFDVDPRIGTDCFVTRRDGSAFLWVDAPFAVLYGGSVAHVQGINQDHDMLVINFNPLTKDRTPDTVVYRRKIN